MIYKHNFSLKEQKFFKYIYNNNMQVTVKELKKAGVNLTVAYEDMPQKTVWIHDSQNDFYTIPVFSKIQMIDDTGIFYFTNISLQIEELIKMFDDEFLDEKNYEDLKKLKGKNTHVLYKILIYSFKNNILKYNLDVFKFMIGGSGYKHITDYKKNVLDKTIEEINKNCSIIVSYNLKKTGNKYTDVIFNIQSGVIVDDEFIKQAFNDMVITELDNFEL